MGPRLLVSIPDLDIDSRINIGLILASDLQKTGDQLHPFDGSGGAVACASTPDFGVHVR